MHAKIITFAASALFVLGNAVPLNNGKRDIVWVTEVETAIETVPVTTTVWVDPTGVAAPSSYDHDHGHRHVHSKSSQAAVNVQPTPSPQPSPSPEETPAAPASQEAPSSEEPAPYVAPTTSAAAEPATTAQAEQTTSSTPEPTPETTQAAVTTPEPAYVAPTSSYEAPSSTYVAPAATSSAPASYDSGSSSSGSSSSGSNPAAGKSFTGEVTYFTPGMGACGHSSTEAEHMVAISQTLFDQYTPNGNPNKNPLCGATVAITSADGTTRDATIWDRCTGCAEGDLDMPQSYFDIITKDKNGKIADGRAHGISWTIM